MSLVATVLVARPRPYATTEIPALRANVGKSVSLKMPTSMSEAASGSWTWTVPPVVEVAMLKSIDDEMG